MIQTLKLIKNLETSQNSYPKSEFLSENDSIIIYTPSLITFYQKKSKCASKLTSKVSVKTQEFNNTPGISNVIYLCPGAVFQ